MTGPAGVDARRLTAAAILAGVLGATAMIAAPVKAHATPETEYAATLRAVANQLDRAAKTRGAIPAAHVPPAPICCGPPRFSPSVDDWLQAALTDARTAKSSKERAVELRSVASTLRYLARTSTAPSTSVPRQDAGAAARAILAQAAYHVAQPQTAAPPQESIWARILDWIWTKIGELFSRLAQATDSVPLFGDIIGVVLIGLAVLGLGFVGYRLADGLLSRRRAARGFDAGTPLDRTATFDELRDAALRAAAAGAFAPAVALLFQASLRVLDRGFSIPYDPARTPGEYRRAVRRQADAIAGDFDVLARAFTAAAFAQTPVDEPAWRRAMEAFGAIARPLTACSVRRARSPSSSW